MDDNRTCFLCGTPEHLIDSKEELIFQGKEIYYCVRCCEKQSYNIKAIIKDEKENK